MCSSKLNWITAENQVIPIDAYFIVCVDVIAQIGQIDRHYEHSVYYTSGEKFL